MKYLVQLIAITFLFFATCANASLILNNDDELDIGELLINETFADFYGYGTNIVDSSNTGFELTNTAVFLIANFNNQLALIGTFGSFLSEGDIEGGSLSLTFLNNGIGSLLFVDDAWDSATTNGNETTITFVYNRNRTDGFIFGLGDGTNVDLNLTLDNVAGVDQFVLLNNGSNPYIVGNNFSISSVNISEPSVFMLMVLGVILMFTRKRLV